MTCPTGRRAVAPTSRRSPPTRWRAGPGHRRSRRGARRHYRRLQRVLRRGRVRSAEGRWPVDQRPHHDQVQLGTSHRRRALSRLAGDQRQRVHLWRAEGRPPCAGDRSRRQSDPRSLCCGRDDGDLLPDLHRLDLSPARRGVRAAGSAPRCRSRSVTRFALDGLVALVTGGGGMIGQAVARRLAQGGARLALADRDEPASVGNDCRSYAADLADPAEVRAVVDRTLADFRADRLPDHRRRCHLDPDRSAASRWRNGTGSMRSTCAECSSSTRR